MKTIRFILFYIFFVAISSVSVAQVPELIRNEQFQNDARAAVDSLYNFNPDGADKRLASWKEKYPSHPLWQLMEGMEFWWILLSDLNDTSRDEFFFNFMKKADYAASKLLYDQPGHADALIIRTVANGYIARQYSNREEWITSLNTARKAYRSYGYLEENVPDFPDLQLADGLKLYYSAYLPEAYPIVKTVSWFLPNGNKSEGLESIYKASENAIFARAEATYFLGNINYNYENNYDKAVGYFESLNKAYPNNNYYVRLLVKTYYKLNRYEEALALIDTSLTRWEENDFAFKKVLQEELLFWKGRILNNNFKYSEALPLFKKSFELSRDLPQGKNRSYYAASAYYTGLSLSQLDQKKDAISYFKKVLDAKSGDEYKRLSRERLEQLQN